MQRQNLYIIYTHIQGGYREYRERSQDWVTTLSFVAIGQDYSQIPKKIAFSFSLTELFQWIVIYGMLGGRDERHGPSSHINWLALTTLATAASHFLKCTTHIFVHAVAWGRHALPSCLLPLPFTLLSEPNSNIIFLSLPDISCPTEVESPSHRIHNPQSLSSTVHHCSMNMTCSYLTFYPMQIFGRLQG